MAAHRSTSLLLLVALLGATYFSCASAFNRDRSEDLHGRKFLSPTTQMGEIIFLQRKESIESEPESASRNRSIVVPDPQWFCKQVVGELLLPKEMWEGDSHVTVGADGSIALILFQSFFEHLLVMM